MQVLSELDRKLIDNPVAISKRLDLIEDTVKQLNKALRA